MGNANCGAKKRAAAAAAAANRRSGLAVAGSADAGLVTDTLGAGSDMSGAYSSGYGSAGYVYAMMCPEGIDQDIAMLATAAALAVGIYVVYRLIFLFSFVDYFATLLRMKK